MCCSAVRGSILDGSGCYSRPIIIAEKFIRYRVWGGNGSTFTPDGGNCCLLSSCRRSSHCFVRQSLEPRTSELLLCPPPRRLGRRRSPCPTPCRPALAASPPSPAVVAPESPPLGVARCRYGLDKKTQGRGGRGKKKRKEKRKGNKEKKKKKGNKKKGKCKWKEK
jgi:hypothetical protein